MPTASFCTVELFTLSMTEQEHFLPHQSIGFSSEEGIVKALLTVEINELHLCGAQCQNVKRSKYFCAAIR